MQFYETEREAYMAALAWAASRREDWATTAPVEIFRNEGPWTRGFVAPFSRAQATPFVRVYQARTRGPFARDSERYMGMSSDLFEAAFPA